MNLGGQLSRGNPVVLMGAMTSSYGIGQVIAPLYSVYFIENMETMIMHYILQLLLFWEEQFCYY